MALITKRLRKEIIQSFIRTFSETRHYMFAAKSTPFDDDFNPPLEDSRLAYQDYDLYRDLIFGKHIKPEDVIPMTDKVVWESGETYDFYDDQDPDTDNKSYIITSMENDGSASVFKCINNRLNGVVSITSHRPTRDEVTADDEHYMTNDGYVWKYLYNVSPNIMRKFATEEFIPVVEDEFVTQNAVPGTIDTLIVEKAGSNYNSWTKGSITESAVAGNTLIFGISPDPGLNLSSNSDFYSECSVYISSGRGAGQIRSISEYIVTGTARRIMISSNFDTIPDLSSKFEIGPRITIHGDGFDAKAIAVINPISNSISHVEVINSGHDYSFATISISANTGYIIPNPENDAILRPIISPFSGHGGDILVETKATAVGISATFENDEDGAIPASNDYRVFGILKNPKFNRIELDLDSNAILFQDGERIFQVETNSEGISYNRTGNTVILTDAVGTFLPAHPIVGATSNNVANIVAIRGTTEYFDQRTIFQVDIQDTGVLGNGFQLDEEVYQDVTNAVGFVHSVTTDQITLVNVKGVFSVSDSIANIDHTMIGRTNGAVAKIISKKDGELVNFKGSPLYIENATPVTRDADQSENVKLVLEI